MRKYLTSKAFKEALAADREGTKKSGIGLCKEYTTEIKQVGTEEDRTLEFCITTDSVDRHGDTVAANGWKLNAYEKNPVVLFAHDYDSLPVGKGEISKFAKGLRSTVKFAPASMNPFAEQVYQMCKAGFLNAASVGFIPLDYEDADREGFYPMDIKEQELLEWSIVPVPANGEALMGASAELVNPEVISQWAEKAISGAEAEETKAAYGAIRDRLVKAATEPYGNVEYADPGYQPDGKKRYPIDTEEHVRAAWAYINMPKNEEKYTTAHLASIKSKIEAAAKKFGIDISKPKAADDVAITKEVAAANEAALAEALASGMVKPAPAVAATAEAGATDPVLKAIEALNKRLDKLEIRLAAPAPVKEEKETPVAPALDGATELSAEEIEAFVKEAMDQFEYACLGRVND